MTIFGVFLGPLNFIESWRATKKTADGEKEKTKPPRFSEDGAPKSRLSCQMAVTILINFNVAPALLTEGTIQEQVKGFSSRLLSHKTTKQYLYTISTCVHKNIQV